MIESFFDRYRYTLMALFSGLILIGSGVSLGIGLFGKQGVEEAVVTNATRVSGSQVESGLSNQTIGEKININTATAGELEQLPGIGPSKAKAIVDYRNRNGPFRSPAEIQNVSGIGPKTFEKLKDLITVK